MITIRIFKGRNMILKMARLSLVIDTILTCSIIIKRKNKFHFRFDETITFNNLIYKEPFSFCLLFFIQVFI